MLNEFSRTELLLGAEGMNKLARSRVAIFGIGGVGTFAVEALARSGVGALDLVDDDKVCLTNINRQLIATRKTVGKKKVEVMRDRVLEINPNAKVEIHETFYGAETADQFDLGLYDYIIDAIDTVTAKLILIQRAKEKNVPIISCMGAGNKLDPTRLEVADISKTSMCPLAKVMRTELRRRGIKNLKVVYSKEPPITPMEDESISCKTHCICPPDTKRKCTIRRQVPGSIAFVPSVAGLILAGEVIKDLALPAAESD
ncbi:MAG TPA: tRNA threonylcarbamoyladenosine dehydratase [Anaerovoracaceae bacterium]|nr:tRNA threonylcarbamoyladenosine dehydratase [Anaerovoracaceae bacterium]